jgi:hypothetical protein
MNFDRIFHDKPFILDWPPMENPLSTKIGAQLSAAARGCDSVTKMVFWWRGSDGIPHGGRCWVVFSMMFGMFGTKTRPLSAWSELMLIGVDCS